MLAVATAAGALSLMLVELGQATRTPAESPAGQRVQNVLQTTSVPAKADSPTFSPAAIRMPGDAAPSADSRKPGAAFDRERPGASALRAEVDWYCEYNRKAVDEQARREGLTTDEVKELTFLGFAALKSTQPAEVQKVLGRELSSEERDRLAAILNEENESFKKTMRLEVQQGASLEERWRTIQEFESHYVQLFRQTFGMTFAQFDQLLATNADPRIGAQAVPVPAHVSPPPPEPARPVPQPVPVGDPNRKPDPSSG